MAKLYIYGSSPNFSYSPLYNDMLLPTDSFANTDFAILEPDPSELYEDLSDWSTSSIFGDIRKLQSSLDTMNGSSSTCSGASDSEFLDTFKIKTEIRNIDCMWSAPSATLNGGSLMSSNTNNGITDNNVSASGSTPTGPIVSPAAILQSNTSSSKQQQRIAIAANSKQQQQQQQQFEVQIKTEPNDNDYEQQLQQHSIPNSRTVKQEPQSTQQPQQQQQQTQSLQHIKPGMSLLRKSNVLQQQKNNKQQNKLSSIKIPAKTATEFLRERDQMLSSTTSTTTSPLATTTKNNALLTSAISASSVTFGRPDTPLSLDDDPVAPEFKHNVDLRACVMGSNNISLVGSDPTTFINQLCEQLQDTTKKIDLRNMLPADAAACDSGLLADVLDVIVKDDHRSSSCSINNTAYNNSSSSNSSRMCGGGGGSTSTALHSHHFSASMKFQYDDEEDGDGEEEEEEEDDDDEEEEEDEDDYGEEDDIDSSCGSAASTASQLDYHRSISSASSNAASNISASSYASATSPASSVGGGGGGVNNNNNSQTSYPMMMHSDHSYTRCNDDLGTNLETPSDSDEEIDVVSIGDKKLPTNPSDKDRRALQTKVAHKFSNARIVKTPNGVRTIPPRRRITVELPYTPASSSPVKSVANSRYPSPSATPYQNQYTSKYVQQQTQHIINVMGDGGTMTPVRHHGGGGSDLKQRKRMLANAAAAANNIGGNSLDYMQQPASKKHRGSKKQKQSPHNSGVGISAAAAAAAATAVAGAAAAAGGIVKRHYSMDEAADTLEKRNLHNDMERQRRIGLKNLFEALKKQIPNIKDKERAPKVNILREAAKLCEALTREDAQLCEQKMVLKEQLRKRQELLARLRASVQQRD